VCVVNVRIRHVHTGKEMVGRLGLNDRDSPFDIDSPVVTIHFGNMIGAREFSYNSGYGGKALATSKEAGIRDWRIDPDDLEAIRDMARKEGRKVSPCGKSPGRPRQPKRGKPPHPRQMHFGSIK
jgi:hypothetical protein